MTLIAKQVAAGVPIYDLLNDGQDVGCLTMFPGEGPMATVRWYDIKRTVAATTLHACLIAAQEALAAMDWEAQAEAYIPDEDGDIAFARMLERNAGDGMPDDDPDY